jgi:(1->4)-alpha-D-glucan 1-alpha-D-glucosylmutase
VDPGRVPTATYRIQFHAGFTLRRARELVEYLRDLGVSDIYASPLTTARPGSVHGYDVLDHRRLNPEIGTEEDLSDLAGALRASGMGLLLDVVPNHMCIAGANPWWTDVLENGPSSPYAAYFDIDWKPPKVDLADKILLPFLGDQYGRVLENREIRIEYRGGGFFTQYGDTLLPVAPRSWDRLLRPALEKLGRGVESAPETTELESILTALSHLPLRTETAEEKVRERQREKEVIKRRLFALTDSSETVRRAIEERLEEINGRRGDPRSFDDLERLLADQAYRLCFWKVASDEINYRRFFDINDLAAIRVEDAQVFSSVHERVLQWIRSGWVTGVRVDHVDGLRQPLEYLKALQEGAGTTYVVVEKVLGWNERLPVDWPVSGTTGYDFLNAVNGLFVDAGAAPAFRELYRDFAGRPPEVRTLLATCKKLIMLVSMSSELFMLACLLDRISEQHRWSRDFTLESLRFALREAVAWFPVYRTYVRSNDALIDPLDRERVREAIEEAKRQNPATSPSLFDFIGEVWRLEHPEGLSEEQRRDRLEFVLKLQQFTGPVMAKGLEDTFFYRHFPLASLNEVGGDPGRFGTSVEEFHRWSADRRTSSPRSISATSTHDTKRGEDVRARIDALSEIPGRWRAALARWREMNRRHRSIIDGRELPDANAEYLIYQTLVGTWPFDGRVTEPFARRIEEYMLKALREAKVHTSWVYPHPEYESAVLRFARAILDGSGDPRFASDFAEFVKAVSRAGMLNSLSQTLLKIASPGVPDFYQGTELWQLTLVDPDNRSAVDFDERRRLLDSLRPPKGPAREQWLRGLVQSAEDGRIKMWVTRAGLGLRRRFPELFDRGEYRPLAVRGERAEHVVAFARILGERAAVAVAGRFFLRLGGDWPPVGDSAWPRTEVEVPPGVYRDLITDRTHEAKQGTVSLSLLWAEVPVALWERM